MRQATKAMFLSVALMLCATTAATAADLKVGVVDFARLVEAAPQSQSVQEQLNQQFAPRLKEVQNEGQALQREVENFRRDSPVMGASERERKEADIKRRELDYKRKERELQEDFNIARNESLSRLQRELLVAVQDYAKSKRYDLLVGEGVLYASDKANITDEVLKALEKNAR
ncbi:MAG: OmpH family outer membrane protein [Pseudomonadota bacterium]